LLLIIIIIFCHFFYRANASLNLEKQIKKVDGIVSGFEEKLNKDGPIPDVPNAIQARTQEIQVGGTLPVHPIPYIMNYF
jgi:hypothetical protein